MYECKEKCGWVYNKKGVKVDPKKQTPQKKKTKKSIMKELLRGK